MFSSILKLIKYWYFRYLLVTELYMVEKWERVMIHIVFFIMFSIISLFNNYIVLSLVSCLVESVVSQNGEAATSSEFPQPVPMFEVDL